VDPTLSWSVDRTPDARTRHPRACCTRLPPSPPSLPPQRHTITFHTPLVQLGDLRAGALAQTISGHRERIWAVAWSLRSEFELVSGDGGGHVLVWDVRRAGAVRVVPQQ
jgi:hypothetical protein